MKNKFYSILALGVACLFSIGGAVMVGTNASKEGKYLEVHADDHSHNGTTFSEWTSNSSLPSSGSYYLTNDVTISSTWQPSNGTKLCLNGHGIIMTGTGNAIQVPAAGSLYIYDCNKTTTHKYKVDETGLATVNDAYESDYEIFSGGYITGAKGVSTGGAIYLPGGSSKGNTTRLYMYGGTIIGNKTTGNGAAINYTYKKNMNSEMDIRDTVITGNVADGNSGGIFHHANNRSLTLVNTKIYKNVAASRPAGLCEQAQLNVQGDTYIYENRLKNGSPSDISVNHSGQTDTFTITGELSQNAKFGLDDIRRSTIYNYFSNNNGIPNEVFVSNSNKLVRRDGNNVVYNNVTPTGYSGDYDGQPHSISLALQDDTIDHTIKYGLTEGTYDLDTNPEFTLPGDYTVYYQVTMGLNTHKGSSKVTINALPVDYTAPTAKTDLHYTGETQALVNAGSATNGTMYYKVDDGDWSTDVASAISTGTYTVSYKVVGDAGYESTDPASFQVTISPNDKSALVDKILEKKDYYDSIKNQYPGVASVLDDAIKEAEAVRDDDNKTVQEIADAVTALDNAVTDTDNTILKVNEIIEKINSIGEVTLEKEELITAARTAYDSLSDKVKPDVTNYNVLEDSEEALQQIKDQIEADKVKALINEIGEVELTPECKGKIDEAKAAYDKLTDAQKELVTNKDVLLEDIEQYELLAHQSTVEDNGVKIEGKDGELIPVNVTVKVEVKTSVQAQEGTTEYRNIQEALGNNQKIAGVYDIKLVRTVDGVETVIQPSDIKQGMIIIVEITLPDGLNVEELKVLHIHSENDISFVENFKITGNVLSFETDRLSEVAFVVPFTALQSGLPGWAIALIVIGSLIILCGACYCLGFFLFNKWIKEGDKAIRTLPFAFGKKEGKSRLMIMPFKFVYRDSNEIYKTKEEALR